MTRKAGPAHGHGMIGNDQFVRAFRLEPPPFERGSIGGGKGHILPIVNAPFIGFQMNRGTEHGSNGEFGQVFNHGEFFLRNVSHGKLLITGGKQSERIRPGRVSRNTRFSMILAYFYSRIFFPDTIL